MFKFLVASAVILLSYLGFAYVSEYDSPMQILVGYLQIDLSLFTFIIVFLLLQFLLLVAIKLVSIAFNLPYLLRKKFQNIKQKKVSTQLTQAAAEFIAGNKQKATKLIMSIYGQLSGDSRDIANVVIADGSTENEVKIEYYKVLLQSDKLSCYASKKLAEVYLSEKEYLKAEKFALKYFDHVEDDEENILTLIEIYAGLKEWGKLSLLSGKVSKLNSCIWRQHANKIAEHFYEAARNLVKKGDTEQAEECLEHSLEVKPDYVPALHLYTEQAIANKAIDQALEVLKAAFKYNSCFEIARMYADLSYEEPQDAYTSLAAINDPKGNKGTFLALAAYLNLPDMVTKLK